MKKLPKSWELNPVGGALGAEITGVDLSKVSKEQSKKIVELLHENLVLFFPAQNLSPEQHIDFGQKLAKIEGGSLEGHPNLSNVGDLPPEIFELRASAGGVADEWHTDLTFQENPSILSILNMVACPAMGGDTMWTSLYAAFDSLSEPMKALCEGVSALHDASPHNRPMQMAIHPVVRVHPITGKKILYVNEHFTRRIVEMNASESDALLNYLTSWVSSPQFTVRYHWTPGTIAIWDNRATQHFVLNDFSEERIIQRVTVMGDVVTGVGKGKPWYSQPEADEDDGETEQIGAEPNSLWRPWVRSGRLTATSRHDRQLYLHLKSKGLISKE